MSISVRTFKGMAVGLVFIIALQASRFVEAFALQDATPATPEIVLAEGTALNLVTAEEISSKTAKLGDIIKFTVDEDVKVDGQIIIAKGTDARGRVMNAEKSGRMGKSGKLGIQIESTTTVDGQPLALRAAKGKEGNDKTATVAALSAISALFLLKKGGDAMIATSTPVKVFVDEEKRFRFEGPSLVAVPFVNESKTTDEMATVYIYRPSKWVGRALEPSVFCDGVELGRMDNGRYLMLKLKPGQHVIHMTDQSKGFQINMGGGDEYYFRVGIEAGMWKGAGKITLDDNERGVKEVKKLKPLGAGKIKDKTMVVTEETALQPKVD